MQHLFARLIFCILSKQIQSDTNIRYFYVSINCNFDKFRISEFVWIKSMMKFFLVNTAIRPKFYEMGSENTATHPAYIIGKGE